MRKIIMAATAPVIILLLACGSSQSESQTGEKSPISWVKFDDGLNQAAQVDKPVLAYFWRDGCPWCTKMEKGTFSDKNIADYVTDNFIAVKIKSTANEKFNTPFGDMTTPQLVQSLQLRGVPATYFFDAKGQLIFNVPGYVPDDIYKSILQYIAEKHYESKSFEEFQNSANE